LDRRWKERLRQRNTRGERWRIVHRGQEGGKGGRGIGEQSGMLTKDMKKLRKRPGADLGKINVRDLITAKDKLPERRGFVLRERLAKCHLCENDQSG
jgi:hypothetical protein